MIRRLLSRESASGDKVGTVSHLRNQEHIYLVARPELRTRVPDALDRLRRLSPDPRPEPEA